MKPAVPKPQRCAIYTRKSTEHNLDLEFNSLDAQREACEAYIKSQAHEGWRLIPDRYDDGGLSGASLDRPALQDLLADVRAGKVTVVVVYKVDRLTRSLADFAKLVELFDQYGVSFVSITQSFNTTSSMGRLTLNVLLSFAQFEREVIGERVRDKIAASKRKGLWVGGPVPLGYRCLDKKLEIVPEEAETVRTIFSLYLELGSMGALIAELDRRGIRTKVNGRRDGRQSGGIRFGVGPLAHLLKNRFYTGEVTYRGEVHRGEHEPYHCNRRRFPRAAGRVWARRFRCICAVQRWTGMSLQSAARAFSRPGAPSIMTSFGALRPRLTKSSRSARQAAPPLGPTIVAVVDGRRWPKGWRNVAPAASCFQHMQDAGNDSRRRSYGSCASGRAALTH
jgi:DNA invertase Pin-like site-specific DNA recombinase